MEKDFEDIMPWDEDIKAEALAKLEQEPGTIRATDPAEAAEDPGKVKRKWRIEITDFLNRVDRGEYVPIKTNIPFIDDLTDGGFIPGTITMIVADPGAGKTSLCQQLAAQFARNGLFVSFVNYEMDEGQLFARDLAREVKPAKTGKKSGLLYDPTITAGEILRGYLSPARHKVAEEKAKRFRETLEDYTTNIASRLYYNMFVIDEDEAGNLTGEPRPIRNTAHDLRLLTRLLTASYKKRRNAAKEAGEDLEHIHAPILFVDYIQLIATGSENKINALEEVTGILADYARDGRTLVFAISSASKESRRNTQTEKPKKEDEEEPEADGKKTTGRPICIYCDKARFGDPGKVARVQFIGAASKFVSPDYERPRFAGEYEKKGYLCKASANGASVLEYSAAYFISLNRERPGRRSGGERPEASKQNADELISLLNDDE